MRKGERRLFLSHLRNTTPQPCCPGYPKFLRLLRSVERDGSSGPTLEMMRFLAALLFLLSLLPAAAQTAPGVTLHELKDAESLGNELYTNSGATGLVLVVVRGNEVYF